jgi:hypothetical protein
MTPNYTTTQQPASTEAPSVTFGSTEALPAVGAESGMVFCRNCGRATTRLEADLRKFWNGFSGFCGDTLVPRRCLWPTT